MNIKGLLFDLDGVLVNTEHNHFIAWKRTAKKLGISFSEKDNELLKGVSRVDSLKAILKLGDLQVSEQEFEALLTFKNDIYLDSISALSPADLLPGVASLLLKAKEMSILCGVGSSSKNAKPILKLLGIDSYFKVVVDGFGVKDPKPHPEVFLNGAAALGIIPNSILVFEDAASGIQAAKAGGFKAIGVGNPHVKESADVYINDLTEFNLEEYV